MKKTLKELKIKFLIFLWIYYYCRSLFKLKKTLTVKTKQGVFRVLRSKNDPISRDLFVNKSFELDLMEAYDKFIKTFYGKKSSTKKKTILDIGANNGIICIGMLNNFMFDKAIAIEPDTTNFSLLKHNIDINGLSDRVKLLNMAASDTKTELELELSEDNLGDHRIKVHHNQPETKNFFNESKRKKTKVSGDTLDNLIKAIDTNFTKDISLIWIDVQGYEGYVFKGMKKILTEHKPPVVSEIWPYGLRKAGMKKEDFFDIVSANFSDYWVLRRGRFIKYPIKLFHYYFKELDTECEFGNVIFTF